MTVAPAAEGQARRIGDILLELGFASEEALANAEVEQEKTGQPLGQILVEQGVITRLELASALAEQWSDQSASITLLPVPAPAPRPSAPEPHDEDQYAARLQDAVAELAVRVGANQPSEGVEGRVTDLAQRVEATVARAQKIEATLATLAEQLEGITGGAEEAFEALQTGLAGLAIDLARIDTTVAEIVAKPEGGPLVDPAVEARLEELAASVQGLAERPVVDESVGGRIEQLATELHALAERLVVDESLGARVEQLAVELGAIAERPVVDNSLAARVDALEAHAASLAEIRQALHELESRPVGSPEMDARLALIETELARGVTDTPAAAPDVEKLGAKLEKAVESQKSLAETVDELGSRLEIVARPDERIEQAAAAVVGIESRVDELTQTLDDVRQAIAADEILSVPRRLDELGAGLAAVKDEVAAATRSEPDPRIEQLVQELELVRVELSAVSVAITPDPELSARLDALSATIEQLAGRVDEHGGMAAKLDDVERRLPSDVVTLDDLTHALASVRDELASSEPPPADPRIAQLAEKVDQVTAESAAAAGITARLDEIDRRLPSEIVTPVELAQAIAEARAELAAVDNASPAPDPRIEQLVTELGALQNRIEAASQAPASDPTASDQLGVLAAKLDAFEQRLPAEPVTTADLLRAVDEVRGELATVEPTPAIDTSGLEEGIASLTERLASLEELAARADGRLADSVAAAPVSDVDGASEERFAELTARLDDMTRKLEESGAAKSSNGSAATLDVGGLEELLERNRMTLERLGLHLGEHDRALAELMRPRNLPKRMDDLESRIEELAAGAPTGGAAGPAAGEEGKAKGRGFDRSARAMPGELAHEMKAVLRRVEDAEIANAEDREKLMVRLERMASSIDWRLQRLETPERTDDE